MAGHPTPRSLERAKTNPDSPERRATTINDMKDKQFAKETLQEITQNIIDERGAFNLATVRKWLKAYTWFDDVDKALSLDEQNQIILKTL